MTLHSTVVLLKVATYRRPNTIVRHTLHSTVVLLKVKFHHCFLLHATLHSTVVLLKGEEKEEFERIKASLHSTVVLLKVSLCVPRNQMSPASLHSTVVLLKGLSRTT